MRRRRRITVAVSAGDLAVDFIIQEDRGHELEACLVLCSIDMGPLTGSLSIIERREDGDSAVSDSDVIDVRSIENLGWAVGVAGEVGKPRQGGELGSESGMVCMRPALSEIGAAQHDKVRLDFSQGLIVQPQPFHRPRAKVFDYHIGPGDYPFGQISGLRRFLEI